MLHMNESSLREKTHTYIIIYASYERI